MSDSNAEIDNDSKAKNTNGNDTNAYNNSMFEENDGSTEMSLLNNESNLKSDDNTDDPELEAIKARVREMEEEAEKLKQMQDEVEKQLNLRMTPEEKMEVDSRSIYVGNVDYSATADDLERHFHGCGSVNRVTILCDKYTGHPKGFAYIEFADKDSVQTAAALDESLFKGRQIKVCPKRTNRPGMSTTNRPPRGGLRGMRRGAYMGRGAPWMGGFRPTRRPYGRRGWGYPY
ncbi:polyadenylate-binding protein 2-B-like protein [Dinothrombium tinctorium]|uniref:Polyadenylate-binding protein 2-B-like protein n=1 Tax=Dinothrombium tinctorium TaxID=1965070 RepID=A0A3S3NYM5_9ACAR|nr:polyadenylate-binding protein 2-B-like protein [Dinothrombium tinctorium]